ncbi:DNA replication and repair protein RecF [Synergistales bacterium]|nr:DNA replication and repair protein RecF [Synergistales bacterium]
MRFIETFCFGFRNIKPCRLTWRQGLNILAGANGAGKTNILESLNILSGWGAFGGAKMTQLLSWNDDNFLDSNKPRSAALSCSANGEHDARVEVKIASRATLRLNGDAAGYSDIRASLPSLSFLPSDVNLLDGSPQARRLFLDKVCALLSPLYARRLAEYRRLIRQRTSMLRNTFSTGQNLSLRASAVPLIQLGSWIREVRAQVLGHIHLNMEEGRAEARPCLSLSLDYRGYPDMERGFYDTKERERHARAVLVGPHRDDIVFTCVDGVNKGHFAGEALSRGQKRRAVIMIILAAGRLIEKKLRAAPILLLDDVCAELDETAKRETIDTLSSTGWQTFVTSASFQAQRGELMWLVKDGSVEPYF